MKSSLAIILLVAAGVPALAKCATQSPDGVEIQNGSVKILFVSGNEGYREFGYAKSGLSWRQIVESGSDLRSETMLTSNGIESVALNWKLQSVVKKGGNETVVLNAPMGGGMLTKNISVRRNEPFVRVILTYAIHRRLRLHSLWSTFSFTPGGKPYDEYKPLDFVFTPQLRPEQEQIIADHVFRSPALMMQKDSDFAALVPMLEQVDGKNRAMRTVADLQVETANKPFFSIGLGNWVPEPYALRKTHVFYASPDSLSPTLKDTTISLGYFLFLRADAPNGEGFREVVRHYWMTSGAEYMQHAVGPQAEPFSGYIQKAWYQFLPQVVLDTQYDGHSVTLLRQARLAWSNKLHKAADNDTWFNVWFNALRTAYGMFLYGKQIGDTHLMHEAENVLNLALLAPQKEGIAPTIFYMDSAGGHWVADHAWGGIDAGRNLPMFHNAWTCYWLLQWIDLVPERKSEILRFTGAFAGFLLSHQQASGVIPSWYDPTTLAPVEIFQDENAETAGAALFLAEFYARTKEERYLATAEQAMQYVFTSIVPQRKWFDFETYFSCSRKPIGFFDKYTQQYPQNTLSMHQAAEACYELYNLTGKQQYKESGREIIDYLCLYQQVWSPRWLSCELFGGFGVQNTDAEWSDSRQGYFSVTLMNYYELTGEKEYFERGVAALRAMFSLFESPTSPRTAENYGHSGMDRPAGVTGLHWGTGSSVVSLHLITNRYGDAYVDVAGGWGVGIDGCRIPNVKVTDGTISVDVLDNLSAPRTISLKFGRLTKGEYEITVNKKPLGHFLSTQLTKGIEVAI
jgi:hypothetical protein